MDASGASSGAVATGEVWLVSVSVSSLSSNGESWPSVLFAGGVVGLWLFKIVVVVVAAVAAAGDSNGVSE